MMYQKDYVNAFLVTNFEQIQKARQQAGFSWKPIVQQILNLYPDIGLDPNNEAHRDRVRNNFLYLRKFPKKDTSRPDLQPPSGIGQFIHGRTLGEAFYVAYKAPKVRRLIYDIETSPNLVFSWNIGRKCYLDIDNIIKERAIICICWKWEDDIGVSYLKWNKGDDKEMLREFAKVIDSANEIVTHNGDNFDTKWVRARCMFHGIPVSSKFNSIDTLKLARKQFKLNSNKLTYIAQFLGLGKKMDTGGFNLWKEICLNDNQEAMDKMIEYCQQDVALLESVYKALKAYSPNHTFRIPKPDLKLSIV